MLYACDIGFVKHLKMYNYTNNGYSKFIHHSPVKQILQ